MSPDGAHTCTTLCDTGSESPQLEPGNPASASQQVPLFSHSRPPLWCQFFLPRGCYPHLHPGLLSHLNLHNRFPTSLFSHRSTPRLPAAPGEAGSLLGCWQGPSSSACTVQSHIWSHICCDFRTSFPTCPNAIHIPSLALDTATPSPEGGQFRATQAGPCTGLQHGTSYVAQSYPQVPLSPTTLFHLLGNNYLLINTDTGSHLGSRLWYIHCDP